MSINTPNLPKYRIQGAMIELLIKLQAWSQTFQWYKTFKRIGLVLLMVLIGLVVYLEINDSNQEQQQSASGDSYATNYEGVERYRAEVAAMDDSAERNSFLLMVDAASQEDLEVDDAEFAAIRSAYNSIAGNDGDNLAGE